MRFNVKTLSVLSLCSILLLSLSLVSAAPQTRNATRGGKRAGRKSPSPVSAAPQAPQTRDLQGTYTLDTAASDDVKKAIEATIEGMKFYEKPFARKRLWGANVPPRRIAISYTEAEVSIATDQRPPLRTLVNNVPVDWTREDGEKLKVSTVWEGGQLKRTFKGEEGQRVNLYHISDDGKTLTMHVTVTSRHLPRPLKYKLVYQRAA